MSPIDPAIISLRGAACGHDLIRGSAGEFGHVVELESKSSGAGSRGTNLDNQIADLCLRHLGAHNVPAFPAFAGIEAEDLAAPPGHQRVDLRGGFVRADDLDEMD